MPQNVEPAEIAALANGIIAYIRNNTCNKPARFAIQVLSLVINGCTNLIQEYSIKEPTNY